MTQAPRQSDKTISTWYIDPQAEDAMADGHAPIWRHLIDMVPERDLATKTILDFGCNQGGFLRHLYAIRPFRKALGTDIAEQSIAKANALKGTLPVQYEAMARLDGWDEQFDLGYQIEVLDLIHHLSRDRGVTVIMAIHDLNQAMSISDRICLLKRGEMVFDGEPNELAGSGLIESVFRVRGRFVEIAPDAPPHFDVELARRTAVRA